MSTILLVIGILSLVVGYLMYYKKQVTRPTTKISWVLLFIPLVVGIWTIWNSINFRTPLDTRYVEFSARSLRDYPSWVEEISTTDSDSVVDSYSVKHIGYYAMTYINEYGQITEREIPKATYDYYESLWNCDSCDIHKGTTRRIIKRKYIETHFSGNYKNALVYTKTENYEDFFKNMLTAYNYDYVSDTKAEELGLYQRSNSDVVNDEGLLEPRQSLIYGITVPDSISRAASYMSSYHHKFRPILLIWVGKGNKDQIIRSQRDYWEGGKDNEAVFCVNINDTTNMEILWSGSFSWAANRDFEDYVITSSLHVGEKLDLEEYIKSLEEGYKSDLWSPRDFSDYSIVAMPLNQFIYVFIGILLIFGELVLLVRVFKGIGTHIKRTYRNRKN